MQKHSSTQILTPGAYTHLADLIKIRHQARGFSFLPRQPVHSQLAGRHTSQLRGRGLNFEEIRRYQSGDDIRQIDWKATARTRKTHSRIYTEERERATLLLIDQRASMFFGSVQRTKSTTAAEAAALAAWRVLEQQDRVGALVFNDTDIIEIRPQRSRANVMRILQATVKQNHALSINSSANAKPDMFNEVLKRCDQLAKHDYLVCIISDGDGHNNVTKKLLTHIASHNDILWGFVFDPLEAELPSAGPLVFVNGAAQLEVDTDRRKLRDQYRENFAKSRADGRSFLMHRAVPTIPLDTSFGVAEQVRKQLGSLRR